VASAREAIFSVIVELQNQEGQSKPKPCCIAEWVIRYYPRDIGFQPQNGVRM
jgi:hypothetical protein